MKEYLCFVNFILQGERILIRIYNEELQERRYKIIPLEEVSNHFNHIHMRRDFQEKIRTKEGFSTAMRVKAEKW